MACRSLAIGFASSLETRVSATSSVSGAVDDRGGRARLSGVVAAPGVRRDAGGWGSKFSGVEEPVAKVGLAALVPKSGVRGSVTRQHGSALSGGQP
jgi:hypothetical protein